MRYFFFVLACVIVGVAQEINQIDLVPAQPENLGSWAQVAQPLRLYPTLSKSVRYEGPSLATNLFGEISLGDAQYVIMLGVSAQNEVALWVDFDGNLRLTSAEKLQPTRISGGLAWSFTLLARPKDGNPYEYPLSVLWPEGRGYVFLLGGCPLSGSFQGHKIALVDGDLNGVFGTKGDFLGVDVDGDGKIYADPDGHEYFGLSEAFTLGAKSFKVREISPDGRKISVEETSYVPPKVPLIPGSPAPDFSFRDFVSGQELSLKSFRGKVVLLDFWATWCPPCMASLPGLRQLYSQFHAQGFEIVGVSLDESADDLRQVLADQGISWPVAFEGKRWDNSLAALYRVYQIPTTYLLDRNGVIRYRDLEGEDLAKAVAELINEPAQTTSSGASGLPELSAKAEPILEITVPKETGLRPGEESSLSLRITNASPYLAEEIRFSVQGLPAGIVSKTPDIFDLPAFGERTISLTFLAPKLEPKDFPIPIKVRVEYHYCIAEACFQMVQEAETTLVFGASKASGFVLPWWVLILLAMGVLGTWLIWGRGLSAFSVFIFALALVTLGFGVYLGQARQAQRIAAVLCTSCVGIEEPRPSQAELSSELRLAFAALPEASHLVLFYTPWCRACPYAKNLVTEIAQINPKISVEMVDADSERERAEKAGVVVNGKAVVPAILIEETGKVLFGTNDLATRLLSALKEIP